ncbi:MAG: hypothetical protein Q7O04_06935 [Candidatus Omnitrophota bacterium]|nr:hypothetical protein [Candidatus Omnitrophota bacterium]
MDKYIILGVGKYVVNIEEILDAQYEHRPDNRSYKILGFIDSDLGKQGEEFFGYKVLDTPKWLMSHKEEINVISFINPIGRAGLIKAIQLCANVEFPNIIHPSAIISKKAVIGHGNIFAQNTIVAPYAKIGNFNLFNYAVSIGHHCQLGDFITLNGGVHIADSSTIDDQVFVGPGAVIINGIRIGKRSKIGANAVVKDDIPEDVTAVGVPARILN